jgi:hypothetical protein
MAANGIKNIFLAASVPLPERDPKYIETADIVAIREAVIALCTVVLPTNRLIWGGHPSITPLIYYVMDRLDLNIQNHVRLYQSRFFESKFPKDNNKFENIILTENTGEIESSKLLMREKMLSNEFAFGIFIGGMDGVEEEFQLFTKYHPGIPVLPIGSTGAAARILFEKNRETLALDKRLLEDYTYISLYKDVLIEKLK